MWKINSELELLINHLNNGNIGDDVFNFVWFQDPMPILTDDSEIKLRERDIVYSLGDTIMKNKFTKDMYEIQHFCINEKVFYYDDKIKKEDKIIFIGSSHKSIVDNSINHISMNQLYKEFKSSMESGKVITKKYLQKLSLINNISYEEILFVPLSAAIRECCVEWICKQDKVKVEIYGRDWNNNSIVSPFFKGELPHGEEVSKIYNSAKYALYAHAFDMYQQRLPEIAACGAIPIMYNALGIEYYEFKYEKEVLLFNTYDELISCLIQSPESSVFNISKDMQYTTFINKILKTIQNNIQVDM